MRKCAPSQGNPIGNVVRSTGWAGSSRLRSAMAASAEVTSRQAPYNIAEPCFCIDSAIAAGASANNTATDHSAACIMAASRGLLWRARSCSCRSPAIWRLHADAATAAARGRTFADQLDARFAQCADQLDERIDVAADHAFGGFHALDGRQRQPAALREFAVIDP